MAELNTIGGNAASQLRAIVTKVQKLEAEIKALNADKSDIYQEAKGVGFDKATLRKLIIRMKKDDTDIETEDALLTLYENAVRGVDAKIKSMGEDFSPFDN